MKTNHFYCSLLRAHPDTPTNVGNRGRSAGLRPGLSGAGSCNPAGPEVGAPAGGSSCAHWLLTPALAAVALLAGQVLSPSALAQTVSREGLLRTMACDVIAPGYRDLAAKCRALTVAVEEFVKAPAQQSIEKTREAWTDALLASRRIQWLQSGPIADREYIATFCYSKVLPLRMEAVVDASDPIDEAHVAELGATAKGLFALEYLLFDGNGGTGGNAACPRVLETFSRPGSTRRSHYLVALAHDLESKATQLAGDWTASGDQSAAAKFVAGGQASLNRVINEFAQLVEQVSEQRINFILQLPKPISGQLGRIEGSLSGTSQQSVLALLEGAQKLCRGAHGEGLEDYLKHLNAPLAQRLDGLIESAIAATRDIGAPLERVVPDNRAVVDSAYEKTRALEVLCKTDLASALGVTLTFSSNDGD
jgi:predicted lipoprotein